MDYRGTGGWGGGSMARRRFLSSLAGGLWMGVSHDNSDGTIMRPLRELMALIRPDKRDIGTVIAYSVGVGVLALAVPVAAQMMFNYVAFGALTQPLVVIGVAVLVVLALAAVMRGLMSFVVEVLQRRLFVRVVRDLADRLPRVRAEAFDRVSGPEMVNRFFDVLTIQKVGATLLLDGIGAFLQTAIGLLIVAFYHPFLLAFSLGLLAVGLFVVFVMGRTAIGTAIRESSAKYAVAAALERVAASPMAFKQADAHGLAQRLADERALEYLDARRAHFRVFFGQHVAALSVQVLAATSLLTIGGYLVIREQLTLGQLVASELIVTVALASFIKIAGKLGEIYDMFAATHKVTMLLGLPTEREGGEAHTASGGGAGLSLRGVRFAYPGGAEVFGANGGPGGRGLELEVRPGERVAIVGGHGSGKSTLADLMFASREPTAGRIELDGVDLRELRLGSVRRHVAVVRGIDLVEGTIEENVRMERPETTAADFRRALEVVGLLDELRELPRGVGTRLGPGGAPLSRGQLQRLMLARAITGRPRLMVIEDILDEFDPSARERVLGMISDRSWRCTVVMLSRQGWVSEVADRTLWLDRSVGLIEGPAGGPAGGPMGGSVGGAVGAVGAAGVTGKTGGGR